MAKRISKKEKQGIIDDFCNKKTVEEISEKYNFTKLTIIRNLKKGLGEEEYYKIVNEAKSNEAISNIQNNLDVLSDSNESTNFVNEELFTENSFLEIAPLHYEIDNSAQKDLASIPIKDVNLPKVVFMIVAKQIELEIKLLKDYAEWNFLSDEELNRKTIEIYYDLKIAKRSCSKEQKVIKVPNSEVFKITAPVLVSKGISRIVSSDQLIAL